MSESWPSVQEAVKAFIGIRKEIGSPEDSFSCIQFSSNAFVSFTQLRMETALKQASKLTLRGGGTHFSPALKAVSGLVQPGQQVAILFMTDGASTDAQPTKENPNPPPYDPIPDVQSIMGKGAQISFFGVAFTPQGKTKIFQDIVQASKGRLIEAAGVKELRDQFKVIAQDPTAAHAK
jgi:hypothetical protein